MQNTIMKLARGLASADPDNIDLNGLRHMAHEGCMLAEEVCNMERYSDGIGSMDVIARSPDAIFLRIPKEFQRPCAGGCGCDHCTKDPTLANWDTLVVPIKRPKKANDYAHTVHMPDASVPGFIAYWEKRGFKKAGDAPREE